MKTQYQIIIIDTNISEHHCTVEVEMTDDQIIAITEAATIHASDNGYEYDTWEFADITPNDDDPDPGSWGEYQHIKATTFTEPTCPACGHPLTGNGCEECGDV